VAGAVVVWNPQAGLGRRRLSLAAVQSAFSGEEVVAARCAQEATETARKAAKAGAARVVAVGGDGTVRAVAAGLVHTDAVLAVVPAGSGNDLARTFGLPSGLREAAEVAMHGPAESMDAGAGPRGMLFVNVAGIGFDAEVARRFNEAPPWVRRLGVRLRYYLAVFGAFARYPHPSAMLTLDGQQAAAGRLLLAAVGVCRYYGGGLAVCPDADPGDGLFDVVWGDGLGLPEIVRLMGAMPQGRHLDSPKVHSARCRTVRVETASPVLWHLDGDVEGDGTFEARCEPGALRIAVPELSPGARLRGGDGGQPSGHLVRGEALDGDAVGGEERKPEV
jgi:diacylglycerol kinase (ATP)